MCFYDYYVYCTFTDVYEEIHEAYFSHPVMEREIGDGTNGPSPRNGPSARKHLIQQVCVIYKLFTCNSV